MAEVLLEKSDQPVDLSATNDTGNTALHLAICYMDMNRFLPAVGKYIDPNIQNKHGETASIFISNRDLHRANLKELLRFYGKKLDINKQNVRGYTSLMMAVQ